MDTPTLVPVHRADSENGCSRSLVLHHLGLELCPLEDRSFIVHIDDPHRQNLGRGHLRNPMILCYDGQVEDVLLLPV